MLHIVAYAASQRTLAYSIIRWSDGLLYDAGSDTFMVSPVAPTTPLPEDDPPFRGRYRAVVNDTTTAGWPDGVYEVSIHDVALGLVIDGYPVAVKAGDDGIPHPSTPPDRTPIPTPTPTPLPIPSLLQGGFETPVVGAGNFATPVTGSAWTFSLTPHVSNAGISGAGSAYTSGNPAAPEGVQVAFLKKTASISQLVAGWGAGNYTVSFQAAKRSFGGSNDFQVLIDAAVVGTFQPTDTGYRLFTTAPFPVTAGSHTLKFQGLDTAAVDESVLIDDVQIHPAS